MRGVAPKLVPLRPVPLAVTSRGRCVAARSHLYHGTSPVREWDVPAAEMGWSPLPGALLEGDCLVQMLCAKLGLPPDALPMFGSVWISWDSPRMRYLCSATYEAMATIASEARSVRAMRGSSVAARLVSGGAAWEGFE